MSTIKLNLLQGLRQKKRVKEKIAKITQDIQLYNSIPQGAVREIDVRKAIQLRGELKTYLVDLKLKMQDAGRPIQRDILMTAEIKDELTFYRNLDVQHGKSVTVSYNAVELHHEAILRKAEVDRRCMELQRELDELYSKIDEFNTSHFVEVEELTEERLGEPYNLV